jgi:predicted nucleic acid-binding protein
MTSFTLLLDTNVWSHLVLSELAQREKVAAQLAALHVKYPDAAIATSAMCVAECLVAARRLADSANAARFEAIFKARFNRLGVFVVPATEQVLDQAATLRANRLKLAASQGSQTAGAKGGKLLLPDAAIAASCLAFNPPAILVTENDGDFRYLEDGVPKTVANLVIERIG